MTGLFLFFMWPELSSRKAECSSRDCTAWCWGTDVYSYWKFKAYGEGFDKFVISWYRNLYSMWRTTVVLSSCRSLKWTFRTRCWCWVFQRSSINCCCSCIWKTGRRSVRFWVNSPRLCPAIRTSSGGLMYRFGFVWHELD